MNSLSGLIVRLERTARPDRRLDSEIIAAVLGPPGCVLDPVEGLDGWDILLRSGEDGEAAYWRQADDIPGVTAFLDTACELVVEVRSSGAAALIVRALHQLPEPNARMSGADLAGSGARAIIAELLRVLAAEGVGAAQAA